MRRTTKLLICIALCGAIYLCTPSARACEAPGPCYDWNEGAKRWEAYGCVETPCTVDCEYCNESSCVCEPTCVDPVAEFDVGGFLEGEDVIVSLGTELTFDGSDSCDDDGTTLLYSWDFGDTHTGGPWVSVSHTYEEAGEYTAQLVVLDSDYSECDQDCPDHQSDPAYRSIRIVEVESISGEGVTSDATGTPSASQTIYVAKGAPSSTITLTANINPSGGSWPTGEPTWTNATATATAGEATFPIDTVSASSGGTIVTASCGTCGTCTKKIKIVVYEAELKSVTFTSDHGTMTDEKTDWTDSGTVYSEPEWVASPSVNNPISHTMSTSLVIEATVIVGPSGLSFDLSGDGSENYLDFTESGNTSTGSDQAISITADASLPGMVDTLDESITWEIKLTDPDPDVDVTVGDSGSHKIYVTWGTPTGTMVTEKRVSFVVESADDQTTLTTATDELYKALGGSFVLTATAPSPIWLLHNPGENSPCPGLAVYVIRHFQMLGLGTGSVKYCHAKADGTYDSHPSDPGEVTRAINSSTGHPDPTTHDDEHTLEYLCLLDGRGDENSFEATCFFDGYHYPLGVTVPADPLAIPPTPEEFKFATPKEVVKAAFGSTIEWRYVTVVSPVAFATCSYNPWTEAP